ncbi:YjbH domain-containing protein [Palleronia sediminis]|uniref:YjbH domain-containing protein n=1 Tax=Palleronia sediminis TaxID=2547833 RepID=A0A4R6AEV7_9RHOB|nr:YjbH domain-containing protein [Palleronia sediminis]TDL81807.1 YjbH domain-containing protein [Palleronia sediminis]
MTDHPDRKAARRLKAAAAATAIAASLGAVPAAAQTAPGEIAPRPTLNFYGVTGAIDTPSAFSQPDGEFGFTASSFAGINRFTLSFQILPRVQGAFRYTGFDNLYFGGYEDYYDRSFDLTVQVLKERRYLPAMKIGFQDFIGTGVLSGEYIVASKTLAGGQLELSGGIGWGRLGTFGEIGTPFGDRPRRKAGQGGEFEVDQFFKGPAASFASVAYRPNDRLTLTAEYSSDDYVRETGGRGPRDEPLFDRDSAFNFAASYRLNDNVTLGAAYLYGSEFGLRVSFNANPNRPGVVGSAGAAPKPLAERPSRQAQPQAWTTAWVGVKDMQQTFLEKLNDDLETEGLVATSLDVRSPQEVEVHFRNLRYNSEAQAVGRVARSLSRVMPASVETFRIVPEIDGMAVSTLVMNRSSLEATVNAPGGTDALAQTTRIEAGLPIDPTAARNEEYFPRFDWAISPFVRRLLFDPAEPVRLQFGIRAQADYEPLPGLVFSGSVSKGLIGDVDSDRTEDAGNIPQVRTDYGRYNEETDIALDRLTAAYYFDIAPNTYGRVTAGYLERMFGGVSAEVLWKPVDSRLGLGAEINYVQKRGYETQFDFRDYDVVTGHVSAYYELPRGFTAQVDVGRYLAGDVGATLALDREFASGWKIGAYATKTDVSAEDFGEGSFDKGIRVEVPLDWFLGKPTRQTLSTSVSPVTQDGGARLRVDGRLYDRVTDYHESSIGNSFGRVWR